jgi:hypothetical protein
MEQLTTPEPIRRPRVSTFAKGRRDARPILTRPEQASMRNLIAALRHPRAYRWWALRPWRRHSLVLALGGLIYVGIGVAYVATTPSIQLAARIAPITAWGVLFIVTGLLALLSSRWPPASEKWGYSAMSGTSALWAALYFLSTAFFDAHALIGSLVWALITLLWMAVAGLENPADRVIDDRRG